MGCGAKSARKPTPQNLTPSRDSHKATGQFDFVLANPPFNANAVDKEAEGLLDELRKRDR